MLSCLLPQQVPGYFPWISLACAVLLGGTWLVKRNALDTVLRVALYLTVPYRGVPERRVPAAWLDGSLGHFYTALFGFFAVCILVISKFSRRTEGFKSTPMDFLILFLVLMLVKIPGEQLQEYHLGVIAAKIIIFYFSYEVLIAEQRQKSTRLALVTMGR